MVATSRIAVLQPQRAQAFVSQLARQEPMVFDGYDKRLRLAAPDFDPHLKERVLRRYCRHLADLLVAAGEVGCDLAVLPECALPIGTPEPPAQEILRQTCLLAEAVWLETTAPIARRYGMLIASCYYRSEDDKLYNDGVLMDEDGRIAGIYHKVHLPCPVEGDQVTEAGLFTAGTEHPVFDTRIGKIGFQICYDIDFPEGARCLALNGADLILHPTVGYNFPDEEEIVAEARLRTRATDNTLTLAYANFGPSPGRSAIYTHNGNQVACCGRGEDLFAFADIDLSKQRPQRWSNTGYPDHRQALARKRRPDTYGVLGQARPPLVRNGTARCGRVYEYQEEVGLD